MLERKYIEAIEAVWDKLFNEENRQLPPLNDAAYISCCSLSAAISAALSAFDASPWRSMESAPRDGTHILLCEGGNVSEGGWLTGAMMGAEDESCAGWWSVNGVDNPTHWMPLPAAPEAKP